MSAQVDNAIKGTVIEDVLDRIAHPSQTANDIASQRRIAELEEELAQVKQDLLDAQDRLAHVEPVFALAKEQAYAVNPYLQGEKQAQIAAWFSRNGYKNYHEDHNL